MYPKIDFLYLSEPDMIAAGVENMGPCIETMEEMLKLMAIGDYRMGGQNGNSHGCQVNFPDNPAFPEMPKNGPDRRFVAMPAYLGGKFDMAGVKWYGSNVENKKKGLPRSIHVLTLNDKDTGAPVAFMSANVLSAVRTGAIPGVGFKYCAPKNTKQVTIIGPGVMSRTALMAMMAVRPGIEKLKIKGRGKASLERYIAFAKERFPQIKSIESFDNIEEAVKDSDIIYSAVTAKNGDLSQYPYIDGKWVKPGALICSTAALRVDDDFMMPKVRNIADNPKLYEAWHEEFKPNAYMAISIPGVHTADLIAEGKMKKEQLEPIVDILTGKAPARRSEDETILYSVGGMPIEDVAWGTMVYRNAVAKGIGKKLNLWEKPELA